MNKAPATIIKTLSNPYFSYNHWWVNIEYNSYGVLGKTSVMKKTEQEALDIGEGQEILI